MNKPQPNGQRLLRVLVKQIRSGRVQSNDPTTFISYSEALGALGHANPHLFAGRRLQLAGLNELNEWTKATPGIPHIAGLIVNKKSKSPSDGYPASHRLNASGTAWRAWWMAETTKAIRFDWAPYV